MLRIYAVALDWLESLAPVVRSVARADAGLADQLRRSSTSVVLNLAEGMGGCGRAKTNCYRIALREMRESMAALDIALRLGYAEAFDDRDIERQKRIVGTLVKLAQPVN